MKKIQLIVKALVAVGIMLFAGNSISEAQGASRTWVSGVGDDANPCSRTAPCKTFAGAISKTMAGGEIDVIDPGGFGALTIVKAITIDGGGGFASVLVAGTNGIVVVAGASDVVTIRRLSINGLGTGINGIRFLSGGSLHVEECEVFGFSQAGIDFEPGAASQLFVSDTLVRDNVAQGIYVKPGAGSAVASINMVQAYNNGVGIRADDRSNVTIRNTNASGNARNGFIAFSTSGPTNMNVENSTAANNGSVPTSGGVKSDGANTTVRISGNNIFNNSVGLLSNAGGQIISFGNNSVAGNGTDGGPTSTILPK